MSKYSTFPMLVRTIKQDLPEWRISVYERGDDWEAVLGRNFKGRDDRGPHEVRTAIGECAEEALTRVYEATVALYPPVV